MPEEEMTAQELYNIATSDLKSQVEEFFKRIYKSVFKPAAQNNEFAKRIKSNDFPELRNSDFVRLFLNIPKPLHSPITFNRNLEIC